MKKLSNVGAELKKSVAYKKARIVQIIIIIMANLLFINHKNVI